MSWWSRFFGPAPDAIRDELMRAGAAADEDRLGALCAEHHALIKRNFDRWQRVPEDLMEDREGLARYARLLIWIARWFEENKDDGSLLSRLSGPSELRPLQLWREQLATARGHMSELAYEPAIEILHKLDGELAERAPTTPEPMRFQAVVWGHLAEALFHTGRTSEAETPLQQALARCRQIHDERGEQTYLESLYELQRYTGQGAAAADSLEKLAALVEKAGSAPKAARLRVRAALVREGEPPCRVMVRQEEHLVEVGEPFAFDQEKLSFVFMRNRVSLRPAQQALSQGREMMAQGEWLEAMLLFDKACDLDPYDPDPHYQAAHCLLRRERYEEAVERFDQVIERAPGWATVGTDRWLAQQIAAGHLPGQAVAGLDALKSDQVELPRRLELGSAMTTRHPELAPAWLAYGEVLLKSGDTQRAELAWREGLNRADEDDVRTRLLARLGSHIVEPAERSRLLTRAIALRGNLLAAAMAQVILTLSSDAGEGSLAN